VVYLPKETNELKGNNDLDLFNFELPKINPPAPPPTPQSFQSPIKGTWQNSGGFGGKHQGVDMRAPIGTPLYPIAPGVVTNVGTDPLGGNVVNVEHADGVKTYYAHMATVNVQKGQQVDVNTILGAVGKTGNAQKTWPHCHFQVWKNGQIQDPAQFFSIPQYSNLNIQEKIQGMYLSPKAKQDAMAFNMTDHISGAGDNRLASRMDLLVKLAGYFYKASKSI
jgi:murein DD-endopeptidase MepM/ murein hydrolase activator NlpD